MQAISQTLPQLFQGHQALESGDQQLVQRSSQSRIHTQTKTKAELSLVTAEGDTITSFDASLKSSPHIRIKQRTREEYAQAIPSPVSGSTDPGQTPITAKGIDQFANNLI